MSDNNNKILYIIFLILAFILIVYFGINLSLISQLEELDTLTCFSEAIDRTFMFYEGYSPILLFKCEEYGIDLTLVLKNIGICILVYVLAAAWFIFEQQRRAHYKKGDEMGTTRFEKDYKKYNKLYSDPIGSKENNGPYNMVLTEKVRLSMNSFETQLNNNVTVIGGSGSGKSRSFVKPNLLEANTNYIVTDPAGDLLEATGTFLEDNGYTIKVFNLIDMAKSHCYNPFDYIRDEVGVLMMIRCLIRNTTPPQQKAGDPFWEKSEEMLLQALCLYLIEARPKKDRNFTTIMKLLRCAEIDERDSNAASTLDTMFRELEKENPKSLAVMQYKSFKMGAGRTLKSILISCSARLTVFNYEQIAALTRSDEENGIELEKMGEGKRALFVIIPAADSTYNFLAAMMYSQLFETLYYIAGKRANKKLPSPVRCLLDEFANIGEIPEFTKKLATMRKHDISCSIILQNLAQIKTMYKDDWQTILGNCDSLLFLGGQEYETVEYISKELGDSTITVRDSSRSFGKNTNSGNSYKQTKRALMTPDELMRMSNKQCILLIRGLYPFKGPKCNYKKHRNYKYTGDANKKFLYKLEDINSVSVSPEEIAAARERELLKKFKDGSLISDVTTFDTAVKSAGITDADDAVIIINANANEANKAVSSKNDTVTTENKPTITIQSSFEAPEATANNEDAVLETEEIVMDEIPSGEIMSFKAKPNEDEPISEELTTISEEAIVNDNSSKETTPASEDNVPTQLEVSKEDSSKVKKQITEEDGNAVSSKEDGNFIIVNKEDIEEDVWEV